MKNVLRKFQGNQNRQLAFAIIIIALFYIALQFLGITCPFKFLTGISCPGCGLTRACLALIHFDFSEAFYYNPLFLLLPILLVVMLFREHISPKLFKFTIIAAIFLLTIVYIYRMFFLPNEIVVFMPQRGILAKVFSHFL